MNISLTSFELFEDRHHGVSGLDLEQMCQQLNVKDIETLIDETVPSKIRLKNSLNIPDGLSEVQLLSKLKTIAKKNKIFKSFIGCGYYDTIVPAVIGRNILENPAWYTAYTPYQAEVAQGVCVEPVAERHVAAGEQQPEGQ